MLRTKLVCILLISLSSCRDNDFSQDFEDYQYDKEIIRQLSLYDTLRQNLIQNITNFQLNENKPSFEYLYNFDTANASISGHSNRDIPHILYPATVQLFERIGEGNIYGFKISRDSTFEIFLRNTHISKYYLDVRERLQWHPSGEIQKKAGIPSKDTILLDNWRYIIWFDKRAEIL